jgi:hypothetical protein
MSAARIFKAAAEKHKSHNLELAVGVFWYRDMEEAAKQYNHGWEYVYSAWNAYERRQDYTYAAHFEEQLLAHEGALAAKAHMAERFSGEEQEFWKRHNPALQREIKDPTFLFACKAIIEANKRCKAGEEFTWIDLLPVKVAAAIYCSVAYMGGVEFKNE